VTADSLSLLKRRPLGIQAVTNPLPATGAASPETLEEARAKVPSTVRTLDRIVSLQDFEDFARAFAGIGKAQAVPLWNGETQFVHITVAARDGGNVPPDSALYDNLVKAIDAVRDPFQLVEVGSYERLWFNLEATIIVEPRYEAKVVAASIRTALMETFAFEKRAFGQAVTASEAIAAIHKVKGVVAVDLDALYRFSFAKSLELSLSAATARWDRQENESLPAQLLLVNSRGISLKIQPML
jgi:predicted phage baseplate assembly protein